MCFIIESVFDGVKVCDGFTEIEPETFTELYNDPDFADEIVYVGF